MRRNACAGVLAAVVVCASSQRGPAQSDLQTGFRNPPADARPMAWWHWMNGHISKEGIRADLEAMAQAGLAGAQIFDVGVKIPAGPVRFHSPEWFEDVRYAIDTAEKLGLKLTLMNCSGWSESGGPWVPIEDAMKEFVWSEKEVEGGAHVHMKLPPLPSKRDFSRDSYVLAVPGDAAADEKATVSTTVAGADGEKLNDGNLTTTIAFPRTGEPASVTVSYSAPVERRSLELKYDVRTLRVPIGRLAGKIEASDDGAAFRNVYSFAVQGNFRNASQSVSVPFPATSARVFRINFETTATAKIAMPDLAELKHSRAYRVENIESKAVRALTPVGRAALGDGEAADKSAIAPEQVVNLTGRMAADGTLDWDPPAGRWTVLRCGYTATGKEVGPAAAGGSGFEVDKMDAAAVRRHLENSLEKLIAEAGPKAGSTLEGVLMDSWEAETQTWTAAFPEDFKKLRGYDIVPWLPVLTGRVVGSMAKSEAMLADFRLTINDVIAEKHFGETRRFAHEHGMKLYAECYGSNSPLNYFRNGAEVDVNMSEFWNSFWRQPVWDSKERASLVHTLGQNVLASEAFTAQPDEGRWQNTPASLKRVGDMAFIQGINRLIFHSYVHQPRSDLKPGLTLGRYGTNFGRFDTWWPYARAWVDYLSRCQFLLQQGSYVADFLFLRHEDVDNLVADKFPDVPAGYQYDFIAPWQLEKVSADKGRIRLASGGTYRALVLPDRWVADTALLRKFKELRAGGVPVAGPPPVAPQGLKDLEAGAAEWRGLVAELWPGGQAKAGNRDTEFNRLLDDLHQTPDFQAKGDVQETSAVRWIHRRANQADIYFLSNQSDSGVRFTGEFRVTGKVPQLWDAKSGRISSAQGFRPGEKTTSLDMALEPNGSIFVIFGSEATAEGGISAAASEQKQGASKNGTAGTSDTIAVSGPWHVSFVSPLNEKFAREFDSLAEWEKSADETVRYFSGTGTYETTFTLGADAAAAGVHCKVDLGRVYDLAEVRVNGRAAGVVWTAPYEADITGLVKPGENHLQIAVTNTWVNRLIGDERLPQDASYFTTGTANTVGSIVAIPGWYNDPEKAAHRNRKTFSTWHHFEANWPLKPSGLVGPVAVRFSKDVEL